MCGIAGILNQARSPIPRAAIDDFTDSLAHRGPDGRGIWQSSDSTVALGHRRLSILDLSSAGKQPMSFLDGRYWITFNGEIFNFLEVRDELRGRGHTFQSESDTEVLLAGYHEWGSGLLQKLNGMWAFAIYDAREESLFLSRDRFGIKPLFYHQSRAQFAFASELKAFLSLAGFQPSIDYATAIQTLNDPFSVEATAATLLTGVARLRAGYWARLKDGRLTTQRWWNTCEHLTEPPSELEAQVEGFRNLFFDSVRLRLRSDVPVGSCLSGGFDSTAVVCAMSEINKSSRGLRQPRDWQQTFVASFPQSDNDELPAAREAVQFAQVKANYLSITDEYALQDLDRILFDFEDIYQGVPTSTWLIYRALRLKKVVVSLDGHGADELMGAYKAADFLALQTAPSWASAPGANLRILRDLWTELDSSFGTPSKGALASRLAQATLDHHPSFQWFSTMRRTVRRGLKNTARRYFTLGLLNPPALVPQRLPELTASGDTLPTTWDPLARELYRQFHCTLLPTILRNFDRMSMAHGIEVRMPFMDWRLVTYAMSLPTSSKIGGGLSKRVAREAMRDRMPEGIRTSRIKVGFNSPMPRWFAGPLREWAIALATSSGSKNHPLVATDKIARLFQKRRSASDWTWRECGVVWRALHFLWFESHFIRSKTTPPATPK